MRTARVVAALLLAPASVIACAQILGYDELAAKQASAFDAEVGADVQNEVALDAEAETEVEPPFRPPVRPAGAPTPSGKGKTLWFAVKRYRLGSQNAAGVVREGAWKEWGYDLDEVCTSVDDSIKNIGTCQRHPEAKQDFLQDGLGCRDNNFGQHIIAILNVYSEGFEDRVNGGILDGAPTWILRFDDVDDEPDDPYAPAKLYRAKNEKNASSPPKWDGTDVRTVLSDSVLEKNLDKPITEFPKGFIKNNVWVSGEANTTLVIMPVSSDLFVPVTLEGAVFSFVLGADRKSGTGGVMAGAIPAAAIEKLLRPIAINAGFCPGTPLYQSLLKTVARFPDLVVGAPKLQDTSKQCDGISIGMGFELAPIQPVTNVADPPPPKPTKCDDAG